MKKLLYQPLKWQLLFASLLLLGSIPAYFYVVDFIWIDELDEHNEIVAQRIAKRIETNALEDIEIDQLFNLWSKIQPGISIQPIESNTRLKDSIYEVIRSNPLEKDEFNRFRGLITSIPIQGKFYHLTVETNVEESDETIVSLAYVTVAFMVILLLGMALISQKVSLKIWKPFFDTLLKLKAYDITKGISFSPSPSQIEEFEILNSELIALTERSKNSFTQQKSFIENASHELQTPISVLKLRIDLLHQIENLKQDVIDGMETLSAPLSKISRINKNMLLLSKIENQQFSDVESLCLSEMLSDNLALLSDFIQQKNIKLSVNVDWNGEINGNKLLLEMLLNNLISNAIIHNIADGSLQIQLKENQLIVSNSGRVSLNESKLFNRFTTASSEKSGTGLGLAICKEICDRYHWKLQYNFTSDCHEFKIEF